MATMITTQNTPSEYLKKSVLLLTVASTLLIVAVVPCQTAEQTTNLTIASTFGDDMVIQRDKTVPVWGRSKNGEEVTVSFADQTKKCTPDETGKWMVKLDAMKINREGRVMTITSGEEKIEIKNILVGEVWIASGQSNMAISLNHSDYVITGSKEAAAAADYPLLRLYKVAFATAGSPKTDCNGSWAICTPESAQEFSAVAYFFGRKLVEDLKDIPVGIIQSAKGGSSIQSWTPQEGLEAIAGTEKGRIGKRKHNMPTVLYNGMIHPLAPTAIRGFIWYQGESDTYDRGSRYRKLMVSMVKQWRKVFQQEDASFYWTQISPGASFGGESKGAGIRDAQRQCIPLIPLGGMACIMDLGVSLHSHEKIGVGERLALLALAKNYGHDLVYSGPLYKSHAVEDGKVRVTFDYAEGLTSKDKQLTLFEVSTQKGKWQTATAEIDKDTILLSADNISDPVHVRYGWKSADGELWNGAGLPASTFTSEGQ